MKNIFKKNSGKKIVFLLLAILSFSSTTFAKSADPSISGSLSDLTSGLWSGIKNGSSYLYKQLPTLTPSATVLLPCKDEIANLRDQLAIIAGGYRDYHSRTFTPGYITQINNLIRTLGKEKLLNHSDSIYWLEKGKQCIAEYSENIDETLEFMGDGKANWQFTNLDIGNKVFEGQEVMNTDPAAALSTVHVGNTAKDGWIWSSNPVCPLQDSIAQNGAHTELGITYVKDLTGLKAEGLHNFEQCMQKPILKSALLAKAYKELTVDKASIEAQASKARWEHTKYYFRKLWESCDLHPALKLAIIGATGSLAAYGIGYKLIWRNLMYRPYKWWKNETPSQLNFRIAMLLKHAAKVNGLEGQKAINQDQLNALITKLKNY